MVLTTDLVKRQALELGFHAVRITTAEPFDEWRRELLAQPGYLAEFPYLLEWAFPERILPAARSLIVAAYAYFPYPVPEPFQGKVARLYLGDAEEGPRYPDLSERMSEWLSSRGIRVARKGPKRAAALRAGLAVRRKNSLAFVDGIGSWVSFHLFVVDAELEPDPPLTQPSCEDCTLCLEACPTGALKEPYLLDPGLCIDRQTWRHDEPVPRPLREGMGTWIYGCDLCQEVCPYNEVARDGATPGSRAETRFRTIVSLADRFDLHRLVNVDEAEYASLWHSLFLFNPDRNDIRRNAAVALGNAVALGSLGDERAVASLATTLADPSPMVRAHAAWALGRIGSKRARFELGRALARETDPAVREEVEEGLERC